MPEQNYTNHTNVPTAFLGVFGLLFLILLGSLWNLYRSLGDHERLYSASLIAVLTLAAMVVLVLARTYSLKAQDRVIRTEENLRHYVLTGQLLDRRLSVKQIIGLRFASDAEFPALATKAASEGMSQVAIKRSVTNWRPDHDRL